MLVNKIPPNSPSGGYNDRRMDMLITLKNIREEHANIISGKVSDTRVFESLVSEYRNIEDAMNDPTVRFLYSEKELLDAGREVTSMSSSIKASNIVNAPTLSSKVSDIIAGNSATYRNADVLNILNDQGIERRLGANVILDRHIQPNQLKALLDTGATHEEILAELRKLLKSTPPVVTTPINTPITTTSKASTTIASSDPVVSVDAPPKVTPSNTTTLPSQPPPLSNTPIEPISTPKTIETPPITTSDMLDSRAASRNVTVQQKVESTQRALSGSTVEGYMQRDATADRLVKEQEAIEAASKIVENDKAIYEAAENARISKQVAAETATKRGVMGATTNAAKEVSSISKIESAGLFSREGKLASKFLKQGPLLKVGAIAAGAWILLATLNSAVKTVTSIGADDNPPNYVSDVYNRIEHNNYSPMPQARRYVNPNSKINTSGLNQRLSSQRIGHTKYAGARSNAYMTNLYGQ